MNLIYKLNELIVRVALAAPETGQIELTPKGDEFSTLPEITVSSIVPVVIQVVLIVAAVVAFIFLIIGGIKWITSGGDKQQVETARGTITAALIGLLIVFAAWALIKLLGYFFSVDIMNFQIPTILDKI